jgi:hypothetical protein
MARVEGKEDKRAEQLSKAFFFNGSNPFMKA